MINRLKQSTCIEEKKNTIESLHPRLDELADKVQEKIPTKKSNGSSSDSIRLAVIELTGLEVATEKITSYSDSFKTIW